MEFDKLVDKAKQTAGKAKDAAAEVIDAGKETALKAKKTADDSLAIGKEKLHKGMATVIEETNNLKVILQNSGYRIVDISVTVSVPPRAKMTIEDKGRGKDELTQLLSDENSNLSKTQTVIIKTILKAYDLAHVTQGYGYVFGKLDLTLSLPPQVTVHLSSDKA